MRDTNAHMTTGQRIAMFRHRRKLTQDQLAGLVGKTGEWLRKVESNRFEVDRVSVLRDLAEVLGVPLWDLLGKQILLQWREDEEHASIPKLRAALTDYTQFLPVAKPATGPDVDLDTLAGQITSAWEDYQHSRYNRTALALPGLVTATATAVRHLSGDAQRRAQRLAASVHQLVGVFTPKLGEADLAWSSARRGLELAQQSGDTPTIGALYRIVAYALGSLGQFDQSAALIDSAVTMLGPELGRPDADGLDLSILGMLHLIGARSAAQADHGSQAEQHLLRASELATRLGYDGNHGYTGFGGVNVQIHRTVVAIELGDAERAVEIGVPLDTSPVPIERRGRHAIEAARALTRLGRVEEAVDLLLSAERYAEEQIRHHSLARAIVRRANRAKNPTPRAVALAGRMGVEAV